MIMVEDLPGIRQVDYVPYDSCYSYRTKHRGPAGNGGDCLPSYNPNRSSSEVVKESGPCTNLLITKKPVA